MKRTLGSWTLLAAVALLLPACGPVEESNANADAGTTGGNTDGGNTQGLEYPLCSSAYKCPSGQFCFNGLCAIGCTSNENCAADQYCDTADLGPPFFCKNKTVQTCPQTPCAQSQVCRQNLCSAAEVPTTTCTPSTSGADGCDKYSVCFDEDDDGPKDPACIAFPPCPESGLCPAGMTGAVCNDGYMPQKGRFCMTGLCNAVDNCPSNWKCVKQTSNQPLGFCSTGGPNQLCFGDADCLSNSCFLMGGAGLPGMCQ